MKKYAGKCMYLKQFLISFSIMMFILFPNMIKNNGLFVYAGDYAYQQIPFNYHVTDYIHSGGIGWDWYTDLGTDFIGSYSFYLLGSIFYWIISFLSANTLIYILPVMIALKTALASVTSMLYIKRYVKHNEYAALGAFLYAFSGFQMFNIVFNHFHDVTALFPLLLLSFDLLVEENKRVFFCVMTAVMAFTNYFFFVGEVIFVVIYYVIKCIKKDYTFKLRVFSTIFLESVIGVACAAVILIPSIYMITSGERTSDFLSGTDIVSYSDNTIIPKIIQSIFIVPDIPAYSQLFQSYDNTHNWASISLYIPLFASVGVISYIKNNHKSTVSAMLICSAVIACVPGLNGVFYMFNSSYYARWFYMPILFMCIATAKSLDEKYSLIPGIKFQAAGIIILSLIGLLPDEVSETTGLDLFGDDSAEVTIKWFAMSRVPSVFWQNIAFAVIMLLVLYVYNVKNDEKRDLSRKLTLLTMLFTVITGVIYTGNVALSHEIKNYRETVTEYTPELQENDFYRIAVLNKSAVNANMIWGEKSITQFHSIVPGSVENMYSRLKTEKRRMFSEYSENDYPVFSLLSVRYVFNESTGDDLNVQIYPVDISGFSLYDKQGCFYIYENDCFIDMGFPYDFCITDAELNEYIDSVDYIENEEKAMYRQLALMRVMVLDEKDIESNKELIKKLPPDRLENLNEDTYFNDCKERAANTCYDFIYDHNGFSAKYDSKEPKIVFFSVPFSRGWTAFVNGKQTEIMNAQYGLSAVCIESGHNEIEFVYETPGIKTGIYITISALMLLAIYIAVNIIFNRRRKNDRNKKNN